MMIRRKKFLRPGNIHSHHSAIQIDFEAEPPLDAVIEAGRLERVLSLVVQKNIEPASRRPIPKAGLGYVDALGELSVWLQRSIGWPTTFYDVISDNRLVFEARDNSVGRQAIDSAVRIAAIIRADAFDDDQIKTEIRSFHNKVRRNHPHFNALSICCEAERRGIDWRRYCESKFVMVGNGRYAKLLVSSETSDVSSIALELAKEKPLAARILAQANLPVPICRTAKTLRKSMAIAKEMGSDIVIKPARGSRGRGITVRPGTPLQLARAIKRAQAIGMVQIEQFIPGEEYRLLVVGGRFSAACQRRPAQVTGTGEHSVKELIALENAKPERSDLCSVYHRMKVDTEVLGTLREQNCDLDTVPPEGQTVFLNKVSNVSRGGFSVDVTDRVHPHTRQLAEAAAKLLRIDICGVDFITPAIDKSYHDVGGAICEINTRPELRMHSEVAVGTGQPVYKIVVDSLFPPGAPSRIPMVVIAGGAVARRTASGLARELASAGRKVAISHGSDVTLENIDHPSIFPLPATDQVTFGDEADIGLIVRSRRDIASNGTGIGAADLVLFDGTVRGSAALEALQRIATAYDLGDKKAKARARQVLGLADKAFA